MLGYHPLSATALSSLEQRVHVLSVLEAVSGAAEESNIASMLLRVLVSTEGTTVESGPNANGGSLAETVDSSDTARSLSTVGLVLGEATSLAESVAGVFGAVPLRIVENTLAMDQPPFVRQRWEFVQTRTGGQWVPVQTGE